MIVRLAVHGALGRMGQRLCALARDDQRFRLVGEFDVGSPLPRRLEGGDRPDVLIDFSSDEGARGAAAFAAAAPAALLVGTTGLGAATLRAIDEAAAGTAVMVAPNTSRGVAVLNHLVAEATRLLGPGFQLDLIEQHHNRKLDAPSGTAKRLLAVLRERAGVEVPADRVHCVRAGDIIGEHEVQFAGRGERLNIAHRAESRDLFAAGALDAAAWLAGRGPGRYTIEQSLGL